MSIDRRRKNVEKTEVESLRNEQMGRVLNAVSFDGRTESAR